MIITKEIAIEDLIEDVPTSVKYLMEQGIRCVVCGEPIWGSLEEAAEEKGFNDDDILRFVDELQILSDNPDNDGGGFTKKVDVKKM